MILQIGIQFLIIPFGIGVDGEVVEVNSQAILDAMDSLNSLANSTATTPTQITKTVAATDTPEALAADGTFFRKATLIGKKSARVNNVGIVYLGIGTANDSQAYEISPNEVVGLSVPNGEKHDLNDWVLDVLNAGDGVIIIYF